MSDESVANEAPTMLPIEKKKKKPPKRPKSKKNLLPSNQDDVSYAELFPDLKAEADHSVSGDNEHYLTDAEFNAFRMACKEQIEETGNGLSSIFIGKPTFKKENAIASFNYVCRASERQRQPALSRVDEDRLRECLIKLLEAQEEERKINNKYQELLGQPLSPQAQGCVLM